MRIGGLIAINAASGDDDLSETTGPTSLMIFTTSLSLKLLKMIGEKRPDICLKQIFQAEAYLTPRQLKAHMECALGSAGGNAFVAAFMNTMNLCGPHRPPALMSGFYRFTAFRGKSWFNLPTFTPQDTHL